MSTATAKSNNADALAVAGQLAAILRIYEGQGLDIVAAHISAALDGACEAQGIDRKAIERDS